MTGSGLFHRHFGGGGNPPLVILHGLLGSSRNWQSVARELAPSFEVYAPDLRNHGSSPWYPGMTYAELAGDVVAWMDSAGLGAVHLLGHSMGGKTAMRFAMDFPERLRSLTVVDIAPRAYGEERHRAEFDAMLAIDPSGFTDRREGDAALAGAGVSDWAMRQFLLTNLSRGETGGFAWNIALRELAAGLPAICADPLRPGETYAGPAFFITGGKSRYVRPEDRAAILRHFPNASLAELPESGHNPHIEDRAAFVAMLVKNLAP